MIYAPPKRKLHADEYVRMGEAGILGWDERVELLDGELFEMTPIGEGHIGDVIGLNFMLSRRLGDRALVSVQNPVRLSDYSEPEPDIAELRQRDDFYRIRKPRPEDVLLLIEVADSSLDYDRLEKLPRYARAGIAEAWLVNLVDRCVEIFRQPVDGRYTSHAIHIRGDTLTLHAFPDVTITVAEILG